MVKLPSVGKKPLPKVHEHASCSEKKKAAWFVLYLCNDVWSGSETSAASVERQREKITQCH